jgi:hypothetical protein
MRPLPRNNQGGSIMSIPIVGGANRGARTFIAELQEKTVALYEPSWILADPKEHRAAKLAAIAKERFSTLRPQPLQMRVQSALPLSGDHDTVVLLLDTISDTLETLRARRSTQRVTFQFAGRGPGGASGTRLAIQGTLAPGDQETERGAHLLLTSLAGMSRAASSRELTGPDAISALVLAPLRKSASSQSALHVAEKEREPRDLSGGPMSVFFGQTAYPLIAVEGGTQEKYSQQTALALESAGGVSANAVITPGHSYHMVVVAVVIPSVQAIHFMRVALQRTGKRSVAGVTSFALPRVAQRSSNNAALFTD